MSSSPQSSDGTIQTPTKFRPMGKKTVWLAGWLKWPRATRPVKRRMGRPCLVHCRKGAGMEACPNGWLVVCHRPALAHTFTQLDCYVPPIPTYVLQPSFSSQPAPEGPTPGPTMEKERAAQSRRNKWRGTLSSLCLPL